MTEKAGPSVAELGDFQSIMDAVLEEAVILLDTEGRIRTWNAGASRLHGYGAEEVIGQPVSIVYTVEDAEAGVAEQELKQAASAGVVEVRGWRKRKDGGRVFARVFLHPIQDGSGQLRGYVKLSRKETASEQIVEASPTAMVLVDPAGTIRMVNQQTETLFGYRREELLGHPVELLVPERVRPGHPGLRDSFFAAPRARAMGAGRDLFGVTKDGRQVPVEIGLTPVETGEGLLALASIVDISERKAAEQIIRELSTPVLQLRDGLLMLPIIGAIDSARARQLTQDLLRQVRAQRAKVVVLDVTGVPQVDSLVANHLVQTVEACRLMGATAVVTGLSAEVAQSLVVLGIDLSKLNTAGDLQGGIEEGDRLLGDRVSRNGAAPQSEG